ncbi:MAG: hypothetical protein U0X71_00110 [Sphingobacteriaceae bacterium]
MLELTPFTFLWLLICLLVGITYAYALYRNQTHFGESIRKILFVLRALAVTTLTFMLVAPLVKKTSKKIEKPIVILAQDNSASIAFARPKGFNLEQYTSKLQALTTKLSSDYDVQPFNFSEDLKRGLNFKFDGKLSDISAVFRTTNNQFANRNVGAVILATDGIYNHGANPQYESKALKAPIYTIALGDTIAKRDLLIANINYNNLVYVGNQFQIEVLVGAYQAKGLSTKLTVSDNTGVVFSQPIVITSNEYIVPIPLLLQAKRKGIQRYTVSLSPIDQELSVKNNSQTIFIEALDGKENVLIIAGSPHPDLSALKSSIDINKNYEAKIELVDQVSDEAIARASLIVLYQVPSVNDAAQAILKRVANKPVLFILGGQSNISAFSAAQHVLGITSSGAMQEAIAKVQPDFYAFTLSEATKTKLQNFAPLQAPFGNYEIKGPVLVALSQQIGKVTTQMPLLVFSNDGQRKVGVLAGEGLWRYRLEEFQESGTHEALDELLSKTVQYLSSKDDKRKFRVYSSKNTFDESEHVIINAELYNDAYELINTPEVNITLREKSGKSYSYLFSKSGNAYLLDAGTLPTGEYTYEAKTTLGSKPYTTTGQFVVSQLQVEFQQTIANHQLLHNLAQQSGGKMIYPNQLDELPKLIQANENIKTITFEDRKYEELINIKWICFLILTMLAVEWFSRKYYGDI